MSVEFNRLYSAFKPASATNQSLVPELRNNLFTFSTLTNFSQVGDILGLIHSVIQDHPPSVRSLRHLDQLVTQDTQAISQALCEIANNKESLMILSRHSEINDLLHHSGLTRREELLQYAPADLKAAVSSLKTSTGVARQEHPVYRYGADYLFGQITGLTDISTAIKAKNAASGQSSFSPVATLKVIADFLLLASFITSSYQREPDRQIYDGLCHMVSLDLFQTARCRTVLSGSENLMELKRLKEEGKSIVLIGNHRSYFDILAAMIVFRDLSPRIVAKDTLLDIPVLGWTPIHHPLQPSRWKEDALLSEHPLVDRKGGPEAQKKMTQDALKAIHKGHVLYGYPEGTRSSTPDRSREWGIQIFKDGLFHVMRELGDIVVAGLHCYGLGCVVPNSLKQDVVEGIKLHQPVVLSVSKPQTYSASQIQEMGVKNLNREVWWKTWQELATLQTLANSILPA